MLQGVRNHGRHIYGFFFFNGTAKVTSVLSVDIFYTSVEACERHFFVCVFLIIDTVIPASTNTESEEQSEDQEFHRQINPLSS